MSTVNAQIEEVKKESIRKLFRRGELTAAEIAEDVDVSVEVVEQLQREERFIN